MKCLFENNASMYILSRFKHIFKINFKFKIYWNVALSSNNNKNKELFK